MNRLIFLLIVCSAGFAQTHRLAATAKTVVFGYFDASTPPVLRMRSGETVEIRSSMIASAEALEAAGVDRSEIDPELRAIYREVRDRGPGPHILTGPIFIEGAEPGDVLEVEIQDIRLSVPYALNQFIPGLGTLPEDFPYTVAKIVRLDTRRMVTEIRPGVYVSLRPFFGCMGVAPPAELGRISSVPPWIHAGNLDNKELVAGTRLFIPIHVKGALFSAGDGHAAQGNGEVDLMALETALIGTFRLAVRKGPRLLWPRAETPSHFITMGFDEDLNIAAKLATRDMIDFLVEEKKMKRDDAYMLVSVAVDLAVTQLVDGKKGIHAMLPKSVFRGSE
jgi:acetamidase/formamidase